MSTTVIPGHLLNFPIVSALQKRKIHACKNGEMLKMKCSYPVIMLCTYDVKNPKFLK